LGLVAEAQDQTKEALNDYLRAIEIDPANVDALIKCGNIYQSEKNYEAALASYRQVAKVAPTIPHGYGLQGDVYFELEKFEDAEREYHRTISLAPEDIRGYYAIGDLYLALARHQAAAKAFEHALKINPNDARSHYGLGLAYEGQGQYQKALQHYQQVATLERDTDRGLTKCGDMYLALNESNRALKAFQQVQRLSPKSAIGFRRSGDVFRSRGDFKAALKMYNEALHRDPRDADTHYGLAVVYDAENKSDEALKHYDAVLELMPQNSSVYLARGDVNMALEHYDRALSDYEKVVELAPKAAEGYFGRGLVYDQKQDYPRAIAEFRQASTLEPNQLRFRTALGRVLYIQADYQEALNELNAVLKAAPHDSTALGLRALVFEALANAGLAEYDYYESFNSALKDYRTLIRLNPSDAHAQAQYASTLLSLKAYDRASKAYDRALMLRPASETWSDKADCLRLWADELDLGSKLDEALAAVDSALQLDPDNASAHAVRAVILIRLNRHNEAVASLERALALVPSYGWALKEKVKALFFGGNLEEALKNCGDVSKNGFPSQGLAAEVLSLRKLHRDSKADEVLNLSTAESHRDPAFFMNLGRAFQEFEAWSDAAKYFLKAIQLNPSSPDAHNELAWLQATRLNATDELLAKCIHHAEMSVALSPKGLNKGNYLDTLGWLWHLKNDNKKAARYLRTAVSLLEPDLVIRHHWRVVQKASK
jgi:tetratricopeptide (TPR) repeat protein